MPPPTDARLRELARSLGDERASMRYVDYGQAEQDCERLAARLLEVFPREELASFRFAAIPRGGLIVLGMLSYLLDLEPSRLASPLAAGDDPDAPVCLVDDCALTGARFGRRLAQAPGSQVVFAHLYSHPDLRRAILEREPRVRACVAAHDLRDHAPGRWEDPAAHAAWQRRWVERLGEERYWYGRPELVCFAWSEPDHPFWNPATGQVEDGWRFLPPHRCLKNRVRLGLPPHAAATVEWRVPEEVACGLFDGVWWVCRTDGGEVYRLEGAAAEIWRALAAGGSAEAAAAELVAQYEIEAEQARGEAAAFAQELAARGLLERPDEQTRSRT
jgi:coenzyme PQQ synthesis protein D (PqqD)